MMGGHFNLLEPIMPHLSGSVVYLLAYLPALCCHAAGPGLSALPVSEDYRVWIDGLELPVHQSVKNTHHGSHGIERMSYVGFDLGKSVTVRVQAARPVTAFALRPYSSSIDGTLAPDNTICFTLREPAKLMLMLNESYDGALAIFANPPHTPPAPESVAYYYGPGLHEIGHHLALSSGDDVYLAAGAVIKGSFAIANAHDVTITGRGVIDGSGIPHQENYRVIRGDHTQNVLIEGITIVDAPGWIISFWGGNENLTVRNVKTVGSFRYNSDGVQTGTVGLLVEDCFLQCNDDNFSLNGICQQVEIRNNVLWNLYNGGVFMLGWATGDHFDLRDIVIHDNVILRAGGCCEYDRKAPISMKVFGSRRRLQNVIVDHLIIEDIAPYGRWLDLQAGKSQHSVLRGIHLSHIDIRDTWSVEAEIRGSETSVIEDVNISELFIQGRRIESPAHGGLNLIHSHGVTLQGQTFADQIVVEPGAAQPIQEKQATGHPTPAEPTGANLLINPGFEEGLKGWSLYNPGQCQGRLVDQPVHGGGSAVKIEKRGSPSTGIAQDVTKLLQSHGPGDYTYGVHGRAKESSCTLHVVLKLVDENGPQWHPSPHVPASTNAWVRAQRTVQATWGELKEAIVYVESGADGRESFYADDFLLIYGR
jgi:hypothetical protein